MLLTGHFFFPNNGPCHDALFVARCEQILSSTPNMPCNSIGSVSTTTLRLVLTNELNITEISSKLVFSCVERDINDDIAVRSTESLLGYTVKQLIDQSIQRIMPVDCWNDLQQAKQNCRRMSHDTDWRVFTGCACLVQFQANIARRCMFSTCTRVMAIE
jgi:hypothetical protein